MSKSHFKDREFVLKTLSVALRERRLALFLGAGVSRSLVNKGAGAIGLPTWPKLIERLYTNRHLKKPRGANYYQQAEDLKNHILGHGGSLAEFHDDVAKALYSGINLDFVAIRANATLAGIGALVSHSMRGQVAEVFTLNFDDVLERYLAYHGIVAKPVFQERFWSEPADVRIHHPHGFLPSPGSQYSKRSSFLVFDERSYVEQHPDSRWNQRIEVAMQSHFCLFVGLSRDDFHLKQLVSKAPKKHAFKLNSDGYWGVVLRASPTVEEIRDWEQYDVHVEPLSDYAIDLPNVLFSVCQKAAKPA